MAWGGHVTTPCSRESLARTLHVEVDYLARVRLDELLARRHSRAHQHVECLIRLDAVVDGDLQQRARAGVHGGVPELLRVHLAQSLVALDLGFFTELLQRR